MRYAQNSFRTRALSAPELRALITPLRIACAARASTQSTARERDVLQRAPGLRRRARAVRARRRHRVLPQALLHAPLVPRVATRFLMRAPRHSVDRSPSPAPPAAANACSTPPRSPSPSATCTRSTSCTATSSPRTCSSPSTASVKLTDFRLGEAHGRPRRRDAAAARAHRLAHGHARVHGARDAAQRAGVRAREPWRK